MLLSEREFRALLGEVDRVDPDTPPPFQFWSYFDSIPTEDFAGHDCSGGSVEWIYRARNGRYEFVHIDTETKNVFMVLVLDLTDQVVVGHHLLDLNRLYGLT